MQVACGSGLERIYRFLQSDEPSNRQGLDFNVIKVPAPLQNLQSVPTSLPGLQELSCCMRV